MAAGSELASTLQAEAEAWAAPSDISGLAGVSERDLPVIDLRGLDDPAQRSKIAAKVQDACSRTGFMYVVNHGLEDVIDQGYAAARAAHSLPNEKKAVFQKGVGFLRTENRILPARALPNYNESFVIKRELSDTPRNASLDDVPWPGSTEKFDGAQFQQTVRRLLAGYEDLAMRLLPIYARALDVSDDYFTPLFSPSPVLRMRLAFYDRTPPGNFGINPHVDTSFFTLLASTDFRGLVLFSKQKNAWLRATKDVRDDDGTLVRNPLVVNTGQILAQLSNDHWPATRHFAINPSPTESRISLPFFFNADARAPLAVLPSCTSPDDPPKYPTLSYLESQAVAQGE